MSKKRAKKSKGKVIRMPLSPENYIRQRARSLPIYECLINPDWTETGLATITIARKHSNGNITFASYLVDIYCLGVKDSFFSFNVSEVSYQKYKDDVSEELDLIPYDYVLVHNIIYGAIEFAEDYGFLPHRDFNLTKYILEEDNENIEVLEIEFGRDGKPMLITNPDNDYKKEIAILEKTAGPGNYILDDVGELDEDYDEDWSDDDEALESLENVIDDIEEMGNWNEKDWSDFGKGKKKLSQETIEFLLNLKFLEQFDKKQVDDIIGEMEDKFDIEIVDEWFPEILGVENFPESDLVINMLDQIADIIENGDVKTAINELTTLIDRYPDIPLLYSRLASLYLIAGKIKKMKKQIVSLYETFPEFILSKIFYVQYLIEKGRIKEVPDILENRWSIQEVAPERAIFHFTEVLIFYNILLVYYIRIDDILRAVLLYDTLSKNGFEEFISPEILIELNDKKNEFAMKAIIEKK